MSEAGNRPGPNVLLSLAENPESTPVRSAWIGPILALGTRLARKADTLPSRVIVHLGTNGGATARELDTIMALLGPDRLVLWSTIQLPDDPTRYTYERSTNDAIAGLAQQYDNALVFDWESVSRQHPEWLYVEGIHMTPEGCEGYAGLVEPQVRAPSPYGNGR